MTRSPRSIPSVTAMPELAEWQAALARRRQRLAVTALDVPVVRLGDVRARLVDGVTYLRRDDVVEWLRGEASRYLELGNVREAALVESFCRDLGGAS